ncbi:MAG: serine hydrolase domain-containing protein [Verrucomicrobiota bacterium]
MNDFHAITGVLRPLYVALAISSPSLLHPADWSTPRIPISSPEAQGMSTPKLDTIRDRLASKKTRAFLVVRNDRLVYEWYAPGVTESNLQGTASLAKALAGGLSLAVAITDGKISIDDPAAQFVPQWKNEASKSRITIRHLGSHTSGLSDSTTENIKHEDQPGWMGDFWKRLAVPRDPFTLARDEAPVLFRLGEKLEYSNPGIGMMAYCVTAAIRGGAQEDIRTLLRQRVMRPIGILDKEWSVGYGQTFLVDGLPLVATWGGGAFTPRAAAKLGRLVLHEGNWDGRQLLSRRAVQEVTGDAGFAGTLQGWVGGLNRGQRYGRLPRRCGLGSGRRRSVVAGCSQLEPDHGSQRRDARARSERAGHPAGRRFHQVS